MKKFRMMLPVLAVVFAVVGAVAGDYLPITQGYYKIDGQCSTTQLTLNRTDCFVSNDPQYPVCTVIVNDIPTDAYNQGCSSTLRHE